MINLSDIKILIIEDRKSVIKVIKSSLVKLESEIGSKFNEKNIFEELIKPNDRGIHLHVDDIFNNVIKNIEKNDIDVLFIDLHYGKTTGEGLNLIRQLMRHDIYAPIPKYIITGDKTFLTKIKDGVFINTDIEHYTTIYDKPEECKVEGYDERFRDKNLIRSLPVLVKIYRKNLDNLNFDAFLHKIEYKIDKNEIDTEKIQKHILKEIELLQKIDNQAKYTLDKVLQIDTVTKAIAQVIPKIATKKQANNIVTAWNDNSKFQDIMGEDMPEMSKGLYNAIKDSLDTIHENIQDDISKSIYDAGKEYIIDYINQKTGVIDEDDKLTLLMKYSTFFIESLSDIALKK